MLHTVLYYSFWCTWVHWLIDWVLCSFSVIRCPSEFSARDIYRMHDICFILQLANCVSDFRVFRICDSARTVFACCLYSSSPMTTVGPLSPTLLKYPCSAIINHDPVSLCSVCLNYVLRHAFLNCLSRITSAMISGIYINKLHALLILSGLWSIVCCCWRWVCRLCAAWLKNSTVVFLNIFWSCREGFICSFIYFSETVTFKN